MADLSLGRLRIANPDENGSEASLHPPRGPETVPAVSPLNDLDRARQDYVGDAGHLDRRRVSPIVDEPALDGTPAASYTESNSSPAPNVYAQRRPERASQRQNVPHTYQDQQQAQFPQYPTMMPQNMHDPRTNVSRPGSTYYTHLPVATSANGVSRQGSYRMRTEGSETSTPQRSLSKRVAVTPQAGVPGRDDEHTDRAYRPPQYSAANGPLPRRTSRGVAPSSRVGSLPAPGGSLSGPPVSPHNPSSTSPSPAEAAPGSSSEDWQERGAADAVQRTYDANGQPVLKPIKKGVKDFNFGQTLGEGSYSTVLAAQDRQSMKDYAIKVLDKRHIIKEKKVKYVNIEKETLNRLTDHPGVVRLYYTFQDERSLYFVLDLCDGGELLGVLKHMTTFDEECTRFYGAQILDTIAYMHSKGVIHRDLKPENVLLDGNCHIKITDFGTAKMLTARQGDDGRAFYDTDSSLAEDRASSFVGTAEYVSPELLTDKNACKASDLWAFGCIIYQLLAGRPPFKAANEYLTFQKIVALEYDFPRGFPDLARDLVERLLVLDPQQRLALEHVRGHPFFEDVRWGRGLWQQPAPRLKAYVPPPAPPIKLNGSPVEATCPGDMTPTHSTHPTIMSPAGAQKPPKPRVVTELPPPSQLDIEWSPVLTRNNERILKLGNLSVTSSQGSHSPGGEGGGGKFSRLFGGGANKKRQRLVMVTSSARLIVAAAGGEEKKSKLEVNLLPTGTEVKSATDAKGVTQWTIKTSDKHFTFEDVKSSASEPHTSALSAQEWLQAIDRAKELVNSQAAGANHFPNDEMPSSAFSSHAGTMNQPPDPSPTPPGHGMSHSGRGVLQKPPSGDNESLKGRKRFSKRQSKSGLTAVF